MINRATRAAKRLVACALGLLAVGLQTNAAAFPIAPYLPLVDGTFWSGTINGVGGYTRTVFPVDNVIKRVAYSPESSSVYYSNDDSGIRLHREFYPSEFVTGCGFTAITATLSPPASYLPADVSIDTTYFSRGDALVETRCGNVQATYSVSSSVIGNEIIGVPLGTFQALKVISTVSLLVSGVSMSQRQEFWLAPNVGIVKELDSTATGSSSSFGETYALVSTSIVRTQPDAFAFNTVTAALGIQVVSNAITLTGTTRPSPISVSGGEYRINGGAWTTSGSVSNGQTIEVRVTAPSVNNSSATAILTIGGVSAPFTVNSPFVPDPTPDAFAFTPQRNVATGTALTSNTVNVTGINVAAPISVTGGSYSVNGGAFTTAAGTVSNGDSVTIRVTSPATDGRQVCAVITIGNVQGPFCVTTGPIDLRHLFQMLLGEQN